MKVSRLFLKVLLALLILFGCSAVLSAVLAARTLVDMLDLQYRSKGTAIAETIARAFVDDVLLRGNADLLQARMEHYAQTEGVAYILVQDLRGEILAHTFESAIPEELCEATRRPPLAGIRKVRLGQKQYLDISVEVLEGQLGQVHVGMNQQVVDAAFWRAIGSQALVVGVIGLVAVLGGYGLVREITKPLSQLARQARNLASLDRLSFSTDQVTQELMPITTRRDEVGQLAKSFVHMIQALGDREQHLQWAEQSLRRSEQYYRSLIENVSDVILLLDGVGKARYISPSLESLLGCPAADWLERDIALLVHPEDRQGFRQAVESCLGQMAESQPAGGKSEAASVEVRMVRLDGTLRIVDASFTNLLLDPAIEGAVVTLRDITDRKRTQELLHARQQAEEASRLKSQLLANISHEFYTPMHQILGLTEMTLETEVNQEQRENLQMLRASAGDLMQVLQNILDFSELENARSRLESVSFGLSSLLHDICALLGPRAQQRGLSLEIELSQELPEVLVGDVDRLRQILLQVIGNAIKFTPQGHVTVQVSPQTSGLIQFRIEDTGVGIPLDKQAVIFEPFVQADGSLKRRFGGTGLGLSIARSLIEQMGGRIWFESTPGQGSVFFFTVALPRRT